DRRRAVGLAAPGRHVSSATPPYPPPDPVDGFTEREQAESDFRGKALKLAVDAARGSFAVLPPEDAAGARFSRA
ncbi:MAG: hypothetical protein ACREFM_10135, partial [Hypericibacter sp.]